MPPKEAKARIKINQLLQESGWRLIDDNTGTANVVLENNMKITHTVADNMGEDYEKTTNGFADYLLLDERGFPLIVLEAKSEDKNPLAGKEQARKYARTQNCGYVILSNGNIHYFWDIEKSNPSIITKYPTQQSIKNYSAYKPQPERLMNEKISEDYIVLTQKPNYSQIPEYQDPNTRDQFNVVNKLRFLRKYQVEAVRAIQDSVGREMNGYVLVGDPAHKYLWILAREKQMDEPSYKMLLQKAIDNGYDVKSIIRVEQDCN